MLPRLSVALLVGACMLVAGCSRLERLTFVRPSASPRGFQQVAPKYDVSGKQANGSADVPMLLASATVLYQRGELDNAESMAAKALQEQPNSSDAHTLLGLIASARGQRDAAGRHYLAAVTTTPGKGVYANNYGGWLCGQDGRAAESLEWFDRALADPGYPTPLAALVNAGDCAQKAGQTPLAERYWRKALTLDAGNLQALAGLARLAYAQGDAFEARAFAERWLAISPEDAAGLQLAADIEQKLGDNVAASRYLSRLQAISSGTTQVPRKQ